MKNIVLLVVGLMAFGGGTVLQHYVLRRQFYRRNDAGLQVFGSYSKMLMSRGLEGAIATAGRVLIVGGCFLALIGGLMLLKGST